MLLPFPNKGKVIYNDSKKRWEKLGGNLYMRFFAQDNIGRPDKEIEKSMRSLRKELERVPELEVPEIKAALVFTEENAEVEANDAPYPTIHALQLKKLIRKEAKGSESLPIPTVKTLQDHFGLDSN